MLRLRVYGPGLVQALADVTAGEDDVRIVLDEGRKRVVVEWEGTLRELVVALQRDNEKREEGR
jgi:hypothetical protein